jgi:hypothetical protein
VVHLFWFELGSEGHSNGHRGEYYIVKN